MLRYSPMVSGTNFQQAIDEFIKEFDSSDFDICFDEEEGEEVEISTYESFYSSGQYCFDFNHFTNFVSEVKSMEISKDDTCFNTLTQSIYCFDIDNDEYYRKYKDKDLECEIEHEGELISISSCSQNIFYDFGLRKFKRVFDKDWYPSCEKPLIVFSYPNPKIKAKFKNQELKYLESFIYELVVRLELQYLSKSTIPLMRESDGYYYDEEYDEELDSEEDEENENKIDSLETYNEGIPLYLSAIQINDHEMKYLGFYKVLEHFSLFATNKEYYQKMIARLNIYNPKNSIKSDYIQSIFDLANEKKGYSSKDKNYLQPLLKELGIESFIELLPKMLIDDLFREDILKIDNVTNRLKVTNCDKLCSQLMKELYDTRNYVAHAKSNITKEPRIKSKEDIKTINLFMNALAKVAITWFNQLPESYQ